MSSRKIDATAKREVIAMVSVGCSLQVAAKYIGVDRSTLWRETKRDEVFRSSIEKAQARNQVTILDKIRSATTEQWRAGAWLLERLNPADFRLRNDDVVPKILVQQLLTEFAKIVAEEIPFAKHRKRIIQQIERLSGIVDESTRSFSSDASKR